MLNSNCNKKNCIAADARLLRCHTSQAANAIITYKIVQTGPNSQFGGVHRGLANPEYHGFKLGTVKEEPINAALRETAMQIKRRIGFLSV